MSCQSRPRKRTELRLYQPKRPTPWLTRRAARTLGEVARTDAHFWSARVHAAAVPEAAAPRREAVEMWRPRQAQDVNTLLYERRPFASRGLHWRNWCGCGAAAACYCTVFALSIPATSSTPSYDFQEPLDSGGRLAFFARVPISAAASLRVLGAECLGRSEPACGVLRSQCQNPARPGWGFFDLRARAREQKEAKPYTHLQSIVNVDVRRV